MNRRKVAPITLVGSGHGCLAALSGLVTHFPLVNLVTEDSRVVAQQMKQGRVYDSLRDSPDKMVVYAG